MMLRAVLGIGACIWASTISLVANACDRGHPVADAINPDDRTYSLQTYGDFSRKWVRAGGTILADTECEPVWYSGAPMALVSLGLTDSAGDLSDAARRRLSDILEVASVRERALEWEHIRSGVISIEGNMVGEAVALVRTPDGRSIFVLSLTERPRPVPGRVWPLGRSLFGQGPVDEAEDLTQRFRGIYEGMAPRS